MSLDLTKQEGRFKLFFFFKGYKCGFELCYFETPFVHDVVEHMGGEHGRNYNSDIFGMYFQARYNSSPSKNSTRMRDWKTAKKVFKCMKCDFTAPKESSFVEHIRYIGGLKYG